MRIYLMILLYPIIIHHVYAQKYFKCCYTARAKESSKLKLRPCSKVKFYPFNRGFVFKNHQDSISTCLANYPTIDFLAYKTDHHQLHTLQQTIQDHNKIGIEALNSWLNQFSNRSRLVSLLNHERCRRFDLEFQKFRDHLFKSLDRQNLLAIRQEIPPSLERVNFKAKEFHFCHQEYMRQIQEKFKKTILGAQEMGTWMKKNDGHFIFVGNGMKFFYQYLNQSHHPSSRSSIDISRDLLKLYPHEKENFWKYFSQLPWGKKPPQKPIYIIDSITSGRLLPRNSLYQLTLIIRQYFQSQFRLSSDEAEKFIVPVGISEFREDLESGIHSLTQKKLQDSDDLFQLSNETKNSSPHYSFAQLRNDSQWAYEQRHYKDYLNQLKTKEYPAGLYLDIPYPDFFHRWQRQEFDKYSSFNDHHRPQKLGRSFPRILEAALMPESEQDLNRKKKALKDLIDQRLQFLCKLKAISL